MECHSADCSTISSNAAACPRAESRSASRPYRRVTPPPHSLTRALLTTWCVQVFRGLTQDDYLVVEFRVASPGGAAARQALGLDMKLGHLVPAIDHAQQTIHEAVTARSDEQRLSAKLREEVEQQKSLIAKQAEERQAAELESQTLRADIDSAVTRIASDQAAWGTERALLTDKAAALETEQDSLTRELTQAAEAAATEGSSSMMDMLSSLMFTKQTCTEPDGEILLTGQEAIQSLEGIMLQTRTKCAGLQTALSEVEAERDNLRQAASEQDMSAENKRLSRELLVERAQHLEKQRQYRAAERQLQVRKPAAAAHTSARARRCCATAPTSMTGHAVWIQEHNALKEEMVGIQAAIQSIRGGPQQQLHNMLLRASSKHAHGTEESASTVLELVASLDEAVNDLQCQMVEQASREATHKADAQSVRVAKAVALAELDECKASLAENAERLQQEKEACRKALECAQAEHQKKLDQMCQTHSSSTRSSSQKLATVQQQVKDCDGLRDQLVTAEWARDNAMAELERERKRLARATATIESLEQAEVLAHASQQVEWATQVAQKLPPSTSHTSVADQIGDDSGKTIYDILLATPAPAAAPTPAPAPAAAPTPAPAPAPAPEEAEAPSPHVQMRRTSSRARPPQPREQPDQRRLCEETAELQRSLGQRADGESDRPAATAGSQKSPEDDGVFRALKAAAATPRMTQAPPPEPTPTRVGFTWPPKIQPGQTVELTLADGRQVSVTAPAGVQPGRRGSVSVSFGGVASGA